MGTFISVQASASSVSVAQRGLADALAAVVRVDRLMHPERSGSDLCAIRKSPPHTPIAIDPWTFQVLALCRRIHAASQGRFDPCLPQAGHLADVELLGDSINDVPRVVKRSAVSLDLGGIAKGFAADRAIDALRSAGCRAGLVNCGGDIAAFGRQAHRIACVDRHGAAVWVVLRDAALASSEVDNPQRPAEHRGYYDGRDRSALKSGHVIVKARSAAIADALTKCLLAGMGPNPAAWLTQFDAEQILLYNRPNQRRDSQ